MISEVSILFISSTRLIMLLETRATGYEMRFSTSIYAFYIPFLPRLKSKKAILSDNKRKLVGTINVLSSFGNETLIL